MLLGRREDIFKPFRELQREIDRLFEDFFRSDLRPAAEAFAPDMDVYETDDEVVVEVEIPGIDRKDVKITVEENILKISGEKKVEREQKGKNYYFVERSAGKFERAIRLPDYVDVEKIKAEYKNGVLTIRIPKKEERKKRVIEVEVQE
ncbi:Hsp20/alpha crystallin family protein [Thermotoga sp. KOL6]|uniref:Hsp20/alpha crystallin family protein n=1 Tax=Thermotoga sp. KOL6 TaxID=126741 RepID=UPI000C78F77C|nr:Hsp20/alpha crystallin family protein [Thermotoga sp. KOL6]PLV59111.1 heat-shock protein Hsp20 [Thermotoga sp. KOL6]